MVKNILIATLLFLSYSFCFAQKAVRTQTTSSEKPLVDIDLGGATGNYNGKTYSEINLGVNLNFTDWLTWRNSGFKRFSSTTDQEISGLDSTLRFISTNRFDNGAFRLFAGVGYRFANPSDKNALVGEGGASIQIGRFALGAGAKYLKYDKSQYDATTGLQTKNEDMNYFVTLAGGAGLAF